MGLQDSPSRKRVGPNAHAIFALTIAAGLYYALFVIDAREQPLAYATGILAASFAWIVLSTAAMRSRLDVSWLAIAGVAVALRVFLQPALPGVLSDDLWRYLWEGRIQLEGYNPFVDAPAELADLGRGDPVWERMNNREISAAYPPVGQLFLRLLASFDLGIVGVRRAFGLMDLATFFALSFALRWSGRDPRRAIVHGLCPLSIVEFCVEGHNDALAIFFLVAALALLVRGPRARIASAATMGLAIASKYLPVVLLPWMWRRARLGYVVCACVFVLASFALFWPGVDRLSELFAGLGEYGARWRHNDSAFALIRAATAGVQEWAREAGVDVWWATAHEDRVAKIPLALIFVSGLAVIFVRIKSPARAFVSILLLLFACTPTLHPWYVCWIVPVLAFRPHPAGFALVAMCSFSYHVLARYHGGDGQWVEETSWKLVEYLPFYAMLVLAIFLPKKTDANAAMTRSGEKRSEYAS